MPRRVLGERAMRLAASLRRFALERLRISPRDPPYPDLSLRRFAPNPPYPISSPPHVPVLARRRPRQGGPLRGLGATPLGLTASLRRFAPKPSVSHLKPSARAGSRTPPSPAATAFLPANPPCPKAKPPEARGGFPRGQGKDGIRSLSGQASGEPRKDLPQKPKKGFPSFGEAGAPGRGHGLPSRRRRPAFWRSSLSGRPTLRSTPPGTAGLPEPALPYACGDATRAAAMARRLGVGVGHTSSFIAHCHPSFIIHHCSLKKRGRPRRSGAALTFLNELTGRSSRRGRWDGGESGRRPSGGGHRPCCRPPH